MLSNSEQKTVIKTQMVCHAKVLDDFSALPKDLKKHILTFYISARPELKCPNGCPELLYRSQLVNSCSGLQCKLRQAWNQDTSEYDLDLLE